MKSNLHSLPSDFRVRLWLFGTAALVIFQALPALAHEEAPADPVMDLQLNQRASVMTQGLINRLELNEGEYIRLRRVHRTLIAAVEEINTEFATQPDLRRAKLQELQGYYEQERARVLTPTQVSHLENRPVRDSLPAIDPSSGGFGYLGQAEPELHLAC
jgi:hypothetical protein